MAGQLVQLKYAPEPTNLQFEPIGTTTLASTSVTIAYPTSSSDLALLTAGMNIAGNGIPDNTTISTISPRTSAAWQARWTATVKMESLRVTKATS